MKLEATLDGSVAELVEDLIDKLQFGESDVESFIAAHQEHEAELRRLLPALRIMADLSLSRNRAQETGNRRQESEVEGTLGDYRIIREVGRGGMGIVYEAEQISLRRRVALKVLPFASALDPRQLQRFRNEALAAASLHHEHIIPVYAVGCERGVHFYAMQFIEGHTLAQFVAELAVTSPTGKRDTNPKRQRATKAEGARGREGERAKESCAETRAILSSPTLPLSHSPARHQTVHFRRAAELIAQAAAALEHAHGLGIVHRDIKPANLMIDETGKLRVGDFGLARFGPDAGLTMSGDLLGTLRYMAPEQALARHGLVDHRADIYGLGCTLYELLTLRPAVGAADRADALRLIAFEEPTAPRKLDKRIPVELETITLKCLAKNPSDRYATAGELADDLRRYLADQAIRAKPPTLLQRIRKWSRRHSSLVASGVAALLLALVTGVAAMAVAQHKTNLAYADLANEQKQSEAARQAAEKQRQRAEIGERLAQQNFEAALDAVDRLLEHLSSDELYDVPLAQPARRKILQDAIQFYKQFLTQTNNSPQVRYRLARAWPRMGYLLEELGESGVPQRRSSSQAARCYATALTISEQLVSEEPDNADYLNLLADNCMIAWRGAGDRRQLSSRAAEIYGRLMETGQEPTNIWAFSLGSYSDRYVHALVGSGQVDLAIEIARRAGHEATNGLADALFTKAQQMRPTSPDEAYGLYKESLRLTREWNSEDSRGQTRNQRSKFSSRIRQIGDAIANVQPQEAEALLREALDLRRPLVANFPENPGHQGKLGECLHSLGAHLRRQAANLRKSGEGEKAQKLRGEADLLFCEATALVKQVVAEHSDYNYQGLLTSLLQSESAYHLTLALELETNGEAADSSGHFNEALALAAEALTHFRHVRDEPGNTGQRNALVKRIQQQVRDLARIPATAWPSLTVDPNALAIKLLDEAIPICRQLIDENAKNLWFRNRLVYLLKEKSLLLERDRRFGQSSAPPAVLLPAN